MSLSGLNLPTDTQTNDLLTGDDTSTTKVTDIFGSPISSSNDNLSRERGLLTPNFGQTALTASLNNGNVSSSEGSSAEGSALWNKTVERLAGLVDQQIFNAYLRPLQFKSFDPALKVCVVTAVSAFIRNQVERAYKDVIELSLREIYGSKVEFKILIGFEGSKDLKPQGPVFVKKFDIPSASINKQHQQAVATSRPLPQTSNSQLSNSQANNFKVISEPLPATINSRYTFESFVVGNNNQFCHAAAMRVAETPGLSYNPLFIYGGVGLGKTHLLHAMGNVVLKKNPNAKVLYMSSETFTNELIMALRNAKMEEFKIRMRGIELLLIDDIQFISGKERTQEEFFHTFNALYNCKHQIVITSDKMPQDIPGLEERLKTRFAWGLTADIQAPDYETRVAILKKKALVDRCDLPADVAAYIAHNVSSNVRELEGALTKLHALSSLQNLTVTLELAEVALKPLLQPKVRNYSIDDIKKSVSEHFNIRVSEMVSKRRTKNLSFPRHVAMYLCRKHTTASYPEIGFQFGGRDHSSVIHAASVVSDKVSSDAAVRDAIAVIERRLQG